jgi:hypothetical protein
MLRAIGRALRILIREALEGIAGWGAYQIQSFGRLVLYSWLRSDREISDAVALAVAGGTLIVVLVVLGLATAFVVGVFSWLTDSSSIPPSQGPGSGHTDPEDRPWWDEGPR